MTSISQVLQAADARLTPETWTQHPSVCRRDKECPHIAIDSASGVNVPVRRAALKLFAEVVSGEAELGLLWQWNDTPGRTLQDVHEAFAAAVAIAQQAEQVTREEEPCSV